jgi:Trypsin-co-occurring domain 1
LAGPEDNDLSVGDYEVAVAVVPAGSLFRGPISSSGDDDQGQPGFDQTSGTRSLGRHVAGRPTLLAKGDTAVKVATEAIARQIGLAAQRIAETIDAQAISSASNGTLSLESVEVSFGVTLTAGVEALFTAKSESSAEVTITLSRRAAD